MRLERLVALAEASAGDESVLFEGDMWCEQHPVRVLAPLP